MSYSDQSRKPSWIDDDNWTSQKTDWEFEFLLIQMIHRPLKQREKDWINAIFKDFEIVDNFE